MREKIIAAFIETVERYNQVVGNPEVELKKACYALDAVEHQKSLLQALGIEVSLEWIGGTYWRVKADGHTYIWDGLFMIEEDLT